MVHLVRNSTKYIPTKHRKEFCSDLRAIYGAVSIGEAENALAVLNEKWGKQYPSAVRVWNDNFVYVQRLFEYPAEIRKIIDLFDDPTLAYQIGDVSRQFD